MPRLLLIENDPSGFAATLGAEGGSGWSCERTAWDAVRYEQLPLHGGVLIVPAALPEPSIGEGFFRWLKDHPVPAPVLALLPEKTEAATLDLVADTASDFILWPASGQECRLRVRRLLGDDAALETVQRGLVEDAGLASLLGRDPAFLRAVEKIPRVSRMGSPVLVTGETGTGKELCARAIHHLGPRRNLPFIPVDCGSLPDNLFENELFGHVKGAFTDARDDQRGLVAMAEGGSLFLDEIDSLSLSAQAKLLRFLQERTYRPLGSDRFLQADVHLIAASNQDLGELVRARRFRLDLYFRLNVLCRFPASRGRHVQFSPASRGQPVFRHMGPPHGGRVTRDFQGHGATRCSGSWGHP